jgi:hypothetical protein
MRVIIAISLAFVGLVAAQQNVAATGRVAMA